MAERVNSHYSFIIIGVSLLSGVVLEGLQWLLVYRTSDFQRKREQMTRFSKKLEANKSNVAAATKKNKKEKRIEETIKTTTRDLHASRLKTGFITGALLLAVYSLMSATFDGIPVAKLPFEIPPWAKFLSKFTHYNLPGDDFTDVSFTCIYCLCQLGIRLNLQRLLGWTPRPVDVPNAFQTFFPNLDPPKNM